MMSVFYYQESETKPKTGWGVLFFVLTLHAAVLAAFMLQHHQTVKTEMTAQPLSVRWIAPEPVVKPEPPVPQPQPEPEPEPVVEPEPLPPPKVEHPSPIKIKPKPVVKKKPVIRQPVQKKIEKPVTQPAVPENTLAKLAPAKAAPAPQNLPVEQPKFNAAYLSNPAPQYPRRSRLLEEEGIVKLKVHVSADGKALSVVIQQSSSFSRLDDAALAAVKNWRFVPAKRGNESIDGWVIVPVSFTLRS